MHEPTIKEPAVFLEDGPLRLVRGYEVVHRKREKFEFVGCVDGPLVSLQGPRGDPLIFDVKFLPRVIEAMQKVAVAPTAADGAYDAQLEAMGYTPPPPRREGS